MNAINTFKRIFHVNETRNTAKRNGVFMNACMKRFDKLLDSAFDEAESADYNSLSLYWTCYNDIEKGGFKGDENSLSNAAFDESWKRWGKMSRKQKREFLKFAWDLEFDVNEFVKVPY